MDRDEALDLLETGEQGIAEWNRRRQAGEKIPSLRGADFNEANLGEANLGEADLTGSQISRSNLGRANLFRANLSHAVLSGPFGK
jgi:hypothetical protein